jgi:hypothetical protein
MTRQKKIILTALFSFFIFALAFGIYLFPDNAPMIAEQSDTALKQAPPPQPQKNSSDSSLKEKLPMNIAPDSNSVQTEQADAAALETNPYVSYPESLFDLLEINMDELLNGRDAFKNTIIHVEWMDHINDILKNLDPVKREAIIKNHTSLLYIKDKLNEAYLTGKIDHETFKKALADLMKWHQHAYESILSEAEYEALFEINPELADDTIDAFIEQAPEYSFILNQEITVEDVKEQVQGYKLEEVNTHFKKMVLDRDVIGKQINSGQMTLEQARAALQQSEQSFIAKCKEILTEDEINTIFGSVTALETGSTQTEPPKVLGDTDEIELGFTIENPGTSIEEVKDRIAKDKIDDIKFFYQQRAQERDELLEKLENNEITPEQLENTSREMDAVFEENCRSTLTNEEYKLIFSTQSDAETESIDNKDMDATGDKKDTESE